MSEREKMLDKVRALLAKTTENGCTEEEHLAAFAKARAMMDAYEIDDAELALTKDEKAILRREPRGSKDPHRIKALLGRSVATFTGCQCWRDFRTGAGEIVFCGLRPDAQLATWLLDHLAAFVQSELAKHLMGDISSGYRSRTAVINGFVDGCATRISERLKEMCETSAPVTGNAKALVVVKGQAVAAKMEEMGAKPRNARASYHTMDSASRAAGRSAGDQASFGRPVEGRGAVLRIGGRS